MCCSVPSALLLSLSEKTGGADCVAMRGGPPGRIPADGTTLRDGQEFQQYGFVVLYLLTQGVCKDACWRPHPNGIAVTLDPTAGSREGGKQFHCVH